MVKNHNFGQILTFGDSCTDSLYRYEGQIWCSTANLRSTLTRQISSECVHCVCFRWPKPQFWAHMDIGGGSCTDPSVSIRTKFSAPEQTHSVRLRAKFRLAPKNRFAVFELRHLVMWTVGGNFRKLNTGAQLQTFPYPTPSKSFLYSSAFMAKSGAQTLAFKSLTNEQTDKNATFLAARQQVKSEPHQTWHGDREPQGVPAPLKRLGV